MATGAIIDGVRSDRGPWAPWRTPMWVAFALLVVAGSIGVAMRIATGHLDAGYGSYVPWGLWVAIYFHGMGIAAGAFAVTAVGYLLGVRGFANGRSLRIGIVLAAAAVAPALLAIALDLGRVERAWRILVTPSFTSMMAFNTWTYGVFLVVCAVAWFLSFRPDRGWLKPFLILGVLLSVMIPSQSGAFLSVVGAKPFWHSGHLPIVMLVSGLTSGAAALLVVRAVLAGTGSSAAWDEAYDGLAWLRRLVLAGIGIYFLMEFGELLTTAWSGDVDPAWAQMLTGQYWWVFWIAHLLLGGIVAAGLLLTRRPSVWVIGAAIVVVAFLSSRLNVLIPGQAVEQQQGLQAAYVHPRLSTIYQATVMEYLVALFALALGIAILIVGLELSRVLERWMARKEHHDA
jgi:protein NrfD